METAHHHHCPFGFQTDYVAEDYWPTCNPQTKLNPFPSPGEGSRGDSSHHQWFKDLHTVLGAFVEKKAIIIFQTFRSLGKSLSAQLPSLMFLHFKLKSEHLIILQ